MKEYDELTGSDEFAMTTTLTSNVIPQIISRRVEAAARPSRIARSVFRINTEIYNKPGQEVIIPKRGTLAAAPVAEGASPAISTQLYTTVTIKPKKFGTGGRITQEAINDNRIGVVDDLFLEVGQALAQIEDVFLLEKLYGKTSSVQSTDVGAGSAITLSNTPLLEVTYVAQSGTTFTRGGSPGWAPDYANGQVLLSGHASGQDVQINYTYSARSNVSVAASAGNLTYTDILVAREGISLNDYDPDVMFINPGMESDLLSNSKFIDASQFGSARPIQRGLLGEIAGIKILKSTNVPESSMLMLDSRHAATMVLKRSVDAKHEPNPGIDSHTWWFFMEIGAGVVNEDALYLIYGVA